jgi:RNA polymerase sigma-70 factor (ECF subfamily)
MSSPGSTSVLDRDLQAAQRGDEGAYQRIVEAHRGELHAHCYRMLGSTHDAEDALQEAMLRSWKSIDRFEGRSSLKSWLYTIATNVCLTQIERRPKRVLPVDYGPATDPHTGPGEPVVESIWIEPYPDERLNLEAGLAGPDAQYDQRESLELAFVAALQHLPATQRAILILREVLGFSAKEVADALDITVAAVNSGLQRARKAVDERVPDESQRDTMQTVGDEEIRALVARYVEAWENNDVDAVVAMLAEDASIAMPPLASWFGPKDQMVEFLKLFPMSGNFHWKAIVKTANGGQPALCFYHWDAGEQAYLPFAINVLSFAGDKVRDVVAFAVRSVEPTEREAYHRWTEQPEDQETATTSFGLFGVPDRLEGPGPA